MSIKKSTGEMLFDTVNVIFLSLISLVTLYPFTYVLFASVSDPASIVQHRGLLLSPLGFQIASYRMVFNNPNIAGSYMNTLLYVASGTSFSLLLTIFGAYTLSRKGLYWKNLIMFLIVFTMWFGGGMIPFFLQVRDLGMLNTRWALIIPRAISTYNLIVMRTAFLSVPDSLDESARIEGANDFNIMFRIIVPLSLPVVSVIALFYAVGQWNAWFDAMLFLNNRALYPLQLILREILILNSTDNMTAGAAQQGDQMQIGETIKYATVIVATAPILCVYPLIQKYFVKGIMIGAIKG